jgi:hypothetical protein
MKKYLVIYHSTKKIECIIILWWVLVLFFVHLTSKLVSILNYTLYHAFTPQLNTLFVNKFIHGSNVFSMHDICVYNVRTYEWTNFTRFSLLIRHMLNLWCLVMITFFLGLCVPFIMNLKWNSKGLTSKKKI